MNTVVVHARARTSTGMFTDDGGPGGFELIVMDT
jgi:hypothetical protein